MDEHQFLEQEINSLKEDIADLKSNVKELTDAFRTANALISFVKWVAGVATGLTALYILLTGHYK